ncbi:MAG TPA: thioesterase [Clostridia bacterium]|nr:thioesterase [Clostridia bacterium]
MHTCEDLIIKESMCDCFRRLKLEHMFVIMQDIAYKDLETYGCGRKSLLDNDIAFLLRRSIVNVINPIYADERIIAGTSQVAQQGMIYIRDFVLSRNDVICVKATSQWFLCRVSDKSLMRPVIKTKSFKEDAVDISISSKPEINANSFEQYDTIKVGYSLIDSNMHVNNTEYVSWACNALNAYKYLEKGVFNFDIYFKKETVLADVILLKYKDSTIYGTTEDNLNFISKFE